MNRRRVGSFITMVFLLLVVTACEQEPGLDSPPLPTLTPAARPTTTPPSNAATAVSVPAPKGALTCPALSPLPPTAPVAARVNGQGISLDYFNRQVAQAQAALVQLGRDSKSPPEQEALKSIRQQVLDQMINDVVIAQQAEKEGIKVTDNDLNGRLAQMVQDAGSVEKLNEYLNNHQLTLSDLCLQVRNQLLGEAMLARVTAALPTQVEQVHARQILVQTAAEANAILAKVRAGGDFAALARQYSMDEASKANGGDLGWFPKGVMDPQFDKAAFQLKPGQVSDVVRTQFGYHIIKVEEHDYSRPLPPELVENARQQAFLAWLQAVRDTMKIERLVQP